MKPFSFLVRLTGIFAVSTAPAFSAEHTGTSYVTTTHGAGAGARVADSAANLNLGNESALARPFNGVIDDVRVYHRVLSAAEMTAIYRAGL